MAFDEITVSKECNIVAQNFQKMEDRELDSFLGQHTPSHFYSPTSRGQITNDKLDTIDRFTMVRSRIV